MKITILIYKLTDSFNGVSWDCCQDYGDMIVVGGYDENLNYHQFDDDAKHLYTWAETYGFRVEKIERQVMI